MSNRHSRTKPWKIGSFTKNFGWGAQPGTLKRLYDAIKIGFQNELKPVERDVFRKRIKDNGYVDLIPVNFSYLIRLSMEKHTSLLMKLSTRLFPASMDNNLIA